MNAERRRDHFPLLITLTFLTLGVAYTLLIPPLENLDEEEHLEVIRYIVTTGHLPVHGSPAGERYHYRQEASQPPLYHILSAGLVRLLHLPTEPASLRPNPYVACGPDAPNLYDNRATRYHNLHAETFPWRGPWLTLHILRLWSLALQTCTVLGTWALARLAFRRQPSVGLLATGIVAFNPQFLLVAAGINNDNLVTPLATWSLYTMLRIRQKGPSPPRLALLGVLIGAAGLAKLSGWFLLPLALLLIVPLLARRPRREAWWPPALLALIPLALGSWWFWRNRRLYGDWTALRPMLAVVGSRSGDIYLHLPQELGLTFLSFWGQIPCSFYPAWFYLPYALLTGGGLAGLLLTRRRLSPSERTAASLLVAWFLLILLGWVRWDLMTPAPGGRLLFPALPALALLLAVGVTPALRRPSLVVLLTLSGASLLIISAFFSPPPRHPPHSAPRPQHPLDARLGDAILLRGYDLALDTAPLVLDATLYWQPVTPITADYTLALQLVSLKPGDTSLRLNYNSWPGRGNYPTSAWLPGEIISDRYRLHLNRSSTEVTQGWTVLLTLYEQDGGRRLPVVLDGTLHGDALPLASLRVPGATPSCPAENRLKPAPTFGEPIALTHAWVTTDTAAMTVSLCWKATQPPPDDYTVFVHLLDGDGNLLATGDGPPLDGAFPTSLWQPGDIIRDTHTLPPLSVPRPGIVVGLYRPADGERLPVLVGETPLPEAAVPIWPPGRHR